MSEPQPPALPAPGTPVEHGRHAAIGTIQSLSAGVVTVPAGLASAALLTRALGPEDYGLLALAMAIATWVQVVVAVGLDRTAVRLVAQSSDWRPAATRLVQVQVGIAVVAALLLAALGGPVADAMDRPGLAALLRWAAIDTVLAALLTLHSAILTGLGQFGRRAKLGIVFWVARLSLIGVMVVWYPVVEAAIWTMIGGSLVAIALARRYVSFPVFRRAGFPLQRIWDYAWPLFFYTIAANVFGGIDLLLVGSLDSDPAAPGYFGGAKNLTILPATFAGAVTPLLLAKLTEMTARGERDAARAMAVRAMRVTLCMLPFAAMTYGAAAEIVVLIYGAEFAPAAPMLSPLIFAAIGGAISTVATAMLLASGRPGLTVWLVVPLAAIAIAVLAVVVPRWGAVGAAHATNLLSWAGAAWGIWLVRSHWPMAGLTASLLRCAVCCVPAYALAAGWPTPGWMLLVKLPIVVAVILASLAATREVNRQDRDFVWSLMGRPTPAAGSNRR